MRSCFQFEGMSMLDHGRSVRSWYVGLRDLIASKARPGPEWRLPEWILSDAMAGGLAAWDDRLVGLYQVYHDCGKPLCRVVGSDGRQRFPDHAAVSRARWSECADGSPESSVVADLIGMDMDVHLLRPQGVAEFSARPQAAVLLATGLAVLHSNASMFGGIESPGFKAKYKRIALLGGRVLAGIASR